MQIRINKKKNKFWSDNRCLNWKILNYFNKIWSSYFSTYYNIEQALFFPFLKKNKPIQQKKSLTLVI